MKIVNIVIIILCNRSISLLPSIAGASLLLSVECSIKLFSPPLASRGESSGVAGVWQSPVVSYPLSEAKGVDSMFSSLDSSSLLSRSGCLFIL